MRTRVSFRPGFAVKTSCSRPWALVARATGTQRAWVTEWIAEQGRVVAFKAVTFNREGQQMQAKPRRFDIDDLIHDWRAYPDVRQWREARRRYNERQRQQQA